MPALKIPKLSENENTTPSERNKNADTVAFPFDISFVDCPPSEAVRFQIEEHLFKLSHLYDRITDCKVIVRIPHKHGTGRSLHINIRLDLPGKKLAVTRDRKDKESMPEVRTAVNDAFHKLTRQLEDFLHARKNHAVRRPTPATASVETTDSEEVQ